ncbi:WXG100 family type VII secretion target [Haloechinothrix halophila]|uniref:ESAT-6-like protein n=1 Tax=Haloechinothrix halophila YIM 93223 TaxID=592678 RepID=W9DRR4_9PSEU|nr:WXG100 family type VII secretion target [Haloechinothrix halophila]ETA66362.1 WXG100 family type VII secretion target [Haloechinothrix halophila YIM 93223]
MSGFTGEVAEFTRIHQSLTGVNSELNSTFRSLQGNMEQALASWKGPAAESFRRLMERFDENAIKLNDSLQGISDLLESAGSKYQAQEEEASQTFSGGGFAALDG